MQDDPNLIHRSDEGPTLGESTEEAVQPEVHLTEDTDQEFLDEDDFMLPEDQGAADEDPVPREDKPAEGEGIGEAAVGRKVRIDFD